MEPSHAAGRGGAGLPPAPDTARPPAASSSTPTPTPAQPQPQQQAQKKRKNRGGRRRRHRRESFAPPLDSPHPSSTERRSAASPHRDALDTIATSPVQQRPSFYRLGQVGGLNLSETSLDSDALLDHRHQPMMRARRDSRLAQSYRPESYRPDIQLQPSRPPRAPRPSSQSQGMDGEESEEVDDRTPLIRPASVRNSSFVRYGTEARRSPSHSPRRKPPSLTSSRRSTGGPYSPETNKSARRDYDVNNPPSVPGSPQAGGPDMGYDDSLITGLDFTQAGSPAVTSTASLPCHAIIDVDGEGDTGARRDPSPSPAAPGFSPLELQRRRTVALPVEEDVCFPTGGLSDLAEEDFVPQRPAEGYSGERRRRRRRVWPDLSVLEEWSREEKEERSGGIRAKKISEPVLVGGRLRPRNSGWRREEEDAPYRFTYFNEEFHSTIHSQTISELVQPGQTFRDLFIPDPPELEDESSDDSDSPDYSQNRESSLETTATNGHAFVNNRSERNLSDAATHTDRQGSSQTEPPKSTKEKRYGPRPTFWLDILSPTDAEMRILSKAFGIHALTAEDIMVQEAREKVELFRHYYFLNYRTFEQDPHSDNFLEPVNMYVIVFREGVLSFHFSMTPHPANVRRRIRQLKDYLILSADWISYAIIDDITDVFGPLIQAVENEVDDIDDTILRLHSDDATKYLPPSKTSRDYLGYGADGASTPEPLPSGSDMLRRVGECRKKVMGLYRLLGNKADVIKGFAKRCNEQWEVAPKSEIGLYLGDIQDHIVTMTSNLSHYETLLSRAHSNYLAQINIRMNERQEQTADVLGKLTVLGTIVLPMNIICGMWGMNVKVPGQDVDNLYWFWSITAGLIVFAVACFYIAKRVYGIV
ncbi:CorA metal ion transporter [Emmonsiellopsis sp. PD_33]|nr:CorA metal ion transporter [Emmonsiellopsis sp. PD_33]KAK2803914.1 CorA metal ion transporter [Onygenales sp. PD_10]